MGRFKVVLALGREGLFVRVYEWSDNIRVADNYHPHVASDGTVCFGDAGPKAKLYASRLDFFGYMSVVKDVLTNYCDDNPYQHLHNFSGDNCPEDEEPEDHGLEECDEDHDPEGEF
jgi:hypothetical protein